MGLYCGAGVSGLIGCKSISPALHCRHFSIIITIIIALDTLQVACCFWPFVQTMNFAYVRERNRVVVVAICSFVWTVFLSYMHHGDRNSLPAFLRTNHEQEEQLMDS